MPRTLALTILAATLAACERTPVANPYLPLNKGRTWTYSLTTSGPGQRAAQTMRVSSLGTVKLEGRKVTKERVQVGSDASLLYVGVDDRGVYRHAAQSAEQAEPLVESEPAYLLDYPLKGGKTWKGRVHPTLLELDVSVPIESTIESTNVTVSVPAGDFTDCVEVTTVGSQRLPPEKPGVPAGAVLINETSWYAKNVGLVKSELEEKLDVSSGHRTRSLTTVLSAYTQ